MDLLVEYMRVRRRVERARWKQTKGNRLQPYEFETMAVKQYQNFLAGRITVCSAGILSVLFSFSKSPKKIPANLLQNSRFYGIINL